MKSEISHHFCFNFKSAKSLDNLGILNLTNSVEMTIERIKVPNVEVENGNLS